MEKNIFTIFELLLDELDLTNGVQRISLVNEGAIERDFVHFHKEYLIKLESINDEKRMVMGPILVPNKMILRAYEEEGQPTEYFYVHFSEDTVRKTAQLFLKNGFQNKTNIQHSEEVDGINFIESWVKDSMEFDKSIPYGYGDMPIGTWFGIAKIDNEDTWNKIKSGEINAFSIEGHFSDRLLQQSKESVNNDQHIDTVEDKQLLDKIVQLLKNTTE